MTRSQFAQLMRIGVLRVDQLRQQGVITQEPDGSWDAVAVMQLLFFYKDRALKAERLLRRFKIIDRTVEELR